MSCKIPIFQFKGMGMNQKPNDLKITYNEDCSMQISGSNNDLNINNSGLITKISGYNKPQPKPQPVPQSPISVINKENSDKCNGNYESTMIVNSNHMNLMLSDPSSNINQIDDNNFTLNDQLYTKNKDNDYEQTLCYSNTCPLGSNGEIGTILKFSDYLKNMGSSFDINKEREGLLCVEPTNINNECDPDKKLLTSSNDICVYYNYDKTSQTQTPNSSQTSNPSQTFQPPQLSDVLITSTDLSTKCYDEFNYESTLQIKKDYVEQNILNKNIDLSKTVYTRDDNNNAFTINIGNIVVLPFTKDINSDYYTNTMCYSQKCPNGDNATLLHNYKKDNNIPYSDMEPNYPICIEDKNDMECDSTRGFYDTDYENKKCLYQTYSVDSGMI